MYLRLTGLLAAVLVLEQSAPLAAQDQAKKPELPAELAVVPHDAFAFVYLRPADLWQSEPAAKLRKLFQRETEQMLKSLGENPEETESFVMVFPSARSFGGIFPDVEQLGVDDQATLFDVLLVETSVKPLERAKLIERLLGKDAVETNYKKRTYHTAKVLNVFTSGAVHFVDDRTYLFAFSTKVMEKALADLDRPRTAGPLSPALRLAEQKRHAVFGLNATQPAADNLRREIGGLCLDRGFADDMPVWALRPLLEVRSAALAIDVGKELRLDAELTFPTARDASKAAAAFEDMAFMLRLIASGTMRPGRNVPFQDGRIRRKSGLRIRGPNGDIDMAAPDAPDASSQLFADLLLIHLESCLRKAKIEQRQATLTIRGQAEIDVIAVEESIRRSQVREDFAFIHLRVADIWHAEAFAKIRKLVPEIEQEFRPLLEMGLAAENVESLTLVLPSVRFPRFFELTANAKRALPGEEFPPPKTKTEIRKEESPKDDKPGKKDFEFDKGKEFQGKEFDKGKDLDKFEPKEIDKIIREEPLFFPEDATIARITTVKPYDRKQLMKTFLQGEKVVEQKTADKIWFTSKSRSGFEQNALHFIDERTFLLVSPGQYMPKILAGPALFQASGPLARVEDLAAKKKHHIVVGVNFTEPTALASKRELMAVLVGRSVAPRGLELVLPLLPLLDVRAAIVVADLGKEARAQAELIFETPEQAAGGLQPLRDGLALLRLLTVSRARAEIRASAQNMIDEDDAGPIVFGGTVLIPGDRPVLVPRRDLRPLFFADVLLEQIEMMLRKASVEKSGAVLKLQIQGKVDVAALEAQAHDDAAAFVKSQEADILMGKSASNLRTLVQALAAYHAVHGKLPASSGNLSWRVHVLPFMDELALYQEFKLNEPWDSPHNIKLLPRMPKVFAPPGIKTKEPFTTHYRAVTGPGTVFDPKWKGLPQGAAIVDAREAVAWTRPAEVVYDAKKPLPKLGGVTPNGFHVAFLESGIVFMSEPVLSEPANEARLRSMFLAREQIDRKPDK